MASPPTQAEADSLLWYHSIDLGNGVVTKGASETIPLDGDCFPDVKGKSVLDIGAWDGYYSFEAEKRGAERVVALDHYVWKIDFAHRNAYWEQCRRDGVVPDWERDATEFFRPGTPGKAGFDFAHAALDSSVEAMVEDFMTVDLDRLGRFDVVFYLGVLYHMPEPLTALRRLRRVTHEVAVVETVAVDIEHHEARPLCAFFAGDELSGDFGNWYTPSERGLHAMLQAAGFRHVETEAGPPPPPPSPPPEPLWLHGARLVRQAVRQRNVGPPPAPAPAVPRLDSYRLVVHAFP